MKEDFFIMNKNRCRGLKKPFEFSQESDELTLFPGAQRAKDAFRPPNQQRLDLVKKSLPFLGDRDTRSPAIPRVWRARHQSGLLQTYRAVP